MQRYVHVKWFVCDIDRGWKVGVRAFGGKLAVGSLEGTNESRGLRDNPWEGKSEVAICFDHMSLLCSIDSPSALPVSPHSVHLLRKLLLS